jgi:hypothetical protein
MTVKAFEIRDRGTFIPVLAVLMVPDCSAELYVAPRMRVGRGLKQNIMKTKIADRIRGAFAVGLSTVIVAAVLLAPTSAEAWHVNFYLFGFFPVPVWITVTAN